MNGSFEADRRSIPLKAKPRQDFITGWDMEYLEGNVASADDDASPRLNYDKSREESIDAIGEKALLITDNRSFKRRVSQVIESTPFVTLPDGQYTLAAKVKVSGSFSQLNMFADTNGTTKVTKIAPVTTDSWQTIRLENIEVKDHRIVIGFEVAGSADARCLIDDVSFINYLSY